MTAGFRLSIKAILAVAFMLIVGVNLAPAAFAEDYSDKVPEPLTIERIWTVSGARSTARNSRGRTTLSSGR